MAQPPTLPTHARITLDQFLAYTGWEVPTPIYRANMQAALARRRRARVHHPESGPGAAREASRIENPKGAEGVPGSAIGSISQAGRVAQARRDDRAEG